MTKKVNINIILLGDIVDVEQNTDMILEAVSYLDLDEIFIQISNEEVG